MRILRRRRLMVGIRSDGGGAADSGGGSGTPGTTTPGQSGQVTGGQPAAPQPSTPAAAPAALPPEVLQQITTQISDSIFANLRRAGVLGNRERGATPPATPPAAGQTAAPTEPTTQPTTPTGTPATMEQVQRELDRRAELDRMLAGSTMPDGARRRLAADVQRENPPDLGEYVRAWATDFGIPLQGASSTPGTPTPAVPPRSAPVTGTVPAAAGHAATDIRDPYALTHDDVEAMRRQFGWHGTGTRIMEALRRAPPRQLRIRR